MAEIESQIGQGIDLTMSDREIIEEQERYNQDMTNGFKDYQTRHSYDQDQEDRWWEDEKWEKWN